MTLAKQGDKVKVHYTGRLEDGTIFDSSLRRDPIEFTIGGRELIPGFEKAVVGMNPGQTKKIKIDSDQAFGPRRSDMVIVVSREKLPEDMEPALGEELQMEQPDGALIAARVAEVTPSAVTLDANHPLAGRDLSFDLQLIEIVCE